ncbi:Ig-like domain-containing protein [Anaerostipes sp.]|uniref:Ig-like domain-containing protein n=1 Tax=Anaerostipes sp. TaxID=1872530 RepID=UPI0025C37758|nr:Ig-like domain-containing protein [Anaerostipes sp.]MBS7007583.1 hypothetical protein [Anaerostipes sp.]
MLDRKKLAGLVFVIAAAVLAAGYTVLAEEREEPSLTLEFEDGESGTYFTKERKLKIVLRREDAEKEKVICFAEGNDGKEKWDEGDIQWTSGGEGSIVFRRQGWYRVTAVYGDESYSVPEFCLETKAPEKPEVNTGSYEQGTWTNRSVDIKLSGGSSFSGMTCFEYRDTKENEWNPCNEDMMNVQKNGIHNYQIRAVSRAGNRSKAVSVCVKVWKKNLHKPDVRCTKTEKNGWYRRDAKIWVNEKKGPGPGIRTRIKVKNLTTGNTKTTEGNRLILHEEGKYQVSIRQKDEAGNESKRSWRKNIFLDRTEPYIHIKREQEETYMRNTCRIEVIIRDRFLDTESVRWDTNGVIRELKRKGDMIRADVYFAEEGKQRLSVACKDQAGNCGESSAEDFFIDRKGPDLQVQGVKPFGIYNFAAEPQVTCTDESPAEISLSLNGKLVKTEKVQPGKQIKLSYPKLSQDGYYSAEICAQDSAGNKTSEKLSFTVSCKGTEIVPVQKTIHTSNSGEKETRFGFHIKNVVPAYVTEFSVNGKTVPYERKGDDLYVNRKYLKNGKNQIKVKMKDLTGHENTIQTPLEFIHDTEPPVILVSGVRNGSTYKGKKEIQVKVQGSAGRLTGLWIDEKKISAAGDQVMIQCKTKGKHRIKAEAVGASGAKSSKAVSFEIEDKHSGIYDSLYQFIPAGIYIPAAFYLVFFFCRTRKS